MGTRSDNVDDLRYVERNSRGFPDFDNLLSPGHVNIGNPTVAQNNDHAVYAITGLGHVANLLLQVLRKDV